MIPTHQTISGSIAAASIVGLTLIAPTVSLGQGPATMAPPVSAGASGGYDANAPASASVYNWHDVPINQKVTIVSAVFDQGGYQLFDDQGETIVVPFVNQNLYVMKFGKSRNGMYFVNDGTTPILHVPHGGYLTNSAAQGAKWYPFDKNYTYTGPVYEGPAPSYDAYLNMGWYPGMSYYGGYWGTQPWSFGLAFSPMPGLFFNIGGSPYYGWGAYSSYYVGHPNNRFYERNQPVFNHYQVGVRGTDSFGRNRNVVGRSTSFGRSNSGFSGRAGQPAFGTAHSSVMRGSRTGAGGRSFGGGAPAAARPSFGGGGGRPSGGGAPSAPRPSFRGGGGGGGRPSGGGGGAHAGGGGGAHAGGGHR